jgi:hypothetical protein
VTLLAAALTAVLLSINAIAQLFQRRANTLLQMRN